MTKHGADAQVKSGILTPNPALLQLQRFVGEWDINASTSKGQSIGQGWTIFKWIEGGAFLVQHAKMEQVEFPAAILVIGRDDAAETYAVLYFDSRGVSRVYQMSLSDDVWKMWRDAPGFSQRFVGTFVDGDRTIRGGWEKSADGLHWEHDFDLTYTKVK